MAISYKEALLNYLTFSKQISPLLEKFPLILTFGEFLLILLAILFLPKPFLLPPARTS